MNWNWACEQMIEGKQVRRKSWGKENYIELHNNEHEVTINALGVGTYIRDEYLRHFFPHWYEIKSNDWELYEEPKKWTEEQREYAKALLLFGAKYLACSGCNGLVDAFTTKPHKSEEYQNWQYDDADGDCCDYILNIELRDIFGNNVKWEDDEPTLLQDIVDSEVE